MFDFSQSYFSLFGLQPAFALDMDQLTRHYRDIQAQVHPDRFAGNAEHEQRLAVQITAFVNQAYQCLKCPLSRAQYLLQIAGHEIKADSQTHSDMEFLLQQMELRERLEAIGGQEDGEEKLNAFINEVQNLEKSLQEKFASAYEQKEYALAIDVVLKWQFLAKLHADADKLQAQFD